MKKFLSGNRYSASDPAHGFANFLEFDNYLAADRAAIDSRTALALLDAAPPAPLADSTGPVARGAFDPIRTPFAPPGNQEPSGTDVTIAIPPHYALRLSNFGFSDTDGNDLLAVTITTLPTAGTLYYDSNGPALGGHRSAVTAGQSISAADIAAGKLVFVADAGDSGAAYASLTFQVQDDGGTAGAGLDLDQSPNTLTFDVAAVAATRLAFPVLLDLLGFDAGNGVQITGEDELDGSGFSVAAAGDVNGDGYADVIIGAPNNANGGANTGAAYVIFGRPDGFTTPLDLAALTPADGFKIRGENDQDGFGSAVAGAGDINGDGFADVIIGASGNGGGGNYPGAAYVIFGKAGGFDPLLDVTTLAPTDGFKIVGEADSDGAGFSVAAAGDINGDGFADIIIGAPGNYGYDAGTSTSRYGAAYVIFGKAGGFGTIDLATLSASDGFKIEDESDGNAGVSVASAGDINGDGYADLLIGAPGNGANGEGAVYVIFGKAGGFAPLVDLGTLSATDGFKITGEGQLDYAGSSVASAGDVNGDGFADIVIGVQFNVGGGKCAGAAYVIFGKAGGFGDIDLASLAPTDGFKIQGRYGDSAGYSVSSAGDVNGDGFADIIVGAIGNYDGGPGAGAAYVIFGKAGGFAPVIDLNALTVTDGFEIMGASYSELVGHSVSAAGDVNGDGFDDLLVGAFGQDYVRGGSYIIYGRANIHSAPSAADGTITIDEDQVYAFCPCPFGFSDGDGDGFATLIIVTLPTAGLLTYDDGSGPVAVIAGQSISVADILSGFLIYTPAAEASGVGYASFTFQVQDNGGTANGGADTDPTVHTLTIDVNNVDDAPVAVADSASTDENTLITFAVLTNDTDVDGGIKTVAVIDGVSVVAGDSVTLASGAIVTLNADGTLSYDPNGSFGYLITAATAAATGAVNTSATDSFDYALNGGLSATVTVTVNGLTSIGDRLNGDDGNNIITGTTGIDYFDLSQGGIDSVSGGNGNDAFFFGAAMTGADHIDGGAGVNDQIGLQGDYTGGNALFLGPNTITGVEVISVLPGYSYVITSDDGNAGAGQTLTIYGTTLGAGDALTFDGSAETDGKFMVYGGLGTDIITTGAGNDGIYFGRGGRFDPLTDHVNGGGGTNDQLALDGSYIVTISGANVVNVEVLSLLDGTPAIHAEYDVTLANDWTAAGQTHTVYGVTVRDGFIVDGSAESDGHLIVYGGKGDDTITTGAGNDKISGGPGADTLNGGLGADIFLYSAVSNSIGTSHDKIVGFDPTVDRIDLPTGISVTGIDAALNTGNVSAGSFDADLTAALGALGAHHAITFTASGGDLSGHIFEVVDTNGIAGYQAGQDMVIELQSPGGAITDTTPFI
jgi:Ca2+-binding RTX toxin-like protein